MGWWKNIGMKTNYLFFKTLWPKCWRMSEMDHNVIYIRPQSQVMTHLKTELSITIADLLLVL